MAQSPLKETTQPVDSEEEVQPWIDDGWKKKNRSCSIMACYRDGPLFVYRVDTLYGGLVDSATSSQNQRLFSSILRYHFLISPSLDLNGDVNQRTPTKTLSMVDGMGHLGHQPSP